jgi:hypothetical protein
MSANVKRKNEAMRLQWNAYMRAYSKANPNKMRARSKTYNAKHPERLPRYRAENREHIRILQQSVDLKKHGLTPATFADMIVAQDGKCAICEKKLGDAKRRDHVDHDPITGKIRGILCSKCNTHRVGANTLATARIVVQYLERAEALNG